MARKVLSKAGMLLPIAGTFDFEVGK